MSIRVVRPRELSGHEIASWRSLQDKDPSLSSPFFSPEYTQALGLARGDAFVAVVESDNRIVGYLPFQRSGRVAKPLGSAICDNQGMIAEKLIPISTRELLDCCDLDAFDFNHVPSAQTLFRLHSFITSHSPYMDLEAGYAGYVARRKQLGVKEIDNALRKARKLQREVGDLRFTVDDESDAAWQRLIDWKNAQYRRSNVPEVLSRTWVVDALTVLRNTKSASFSGLLSTLYADDHLVAVHFGIRSENVWHYWFPAYDPEFQRYSSGLILLLKMAEHGAANGIRMIDLGRGRSRYKSAVADSEIELCEGSIERVASLSGALRFIRKSVEPAWTNLPIGSARTLSRRLFNRVLWRV